MKFLVILGGQMITISVVVPVFNGENFISRTTMSLLDQNLDAFEIIVIDDGSTDSTHAIVAQTFASTLSSAANNRIIRQNNSGVSVARNTGLNNACGKYVIFFDADDLMNRDCLSKLYKRAEETSADIVICGHDKVSEGGEIIKKYPRGYFEGVISGRAALHEVFRGAVVPWTGSVLYRTDFLKRNSVRYQPGCTNGEDGEFIWKALFLANRVACLPETLVDYVQRKGSAVRSPSLARFHEVGALRRLRNFLIKNSAPYELIWNMEERIIPESYIRVLALLAASGLTKNETSVLLKHPFIHSEIRKYTPRSRKELIKSILFKRIPNLYFYYQSRKSKKALP